MMRFCTACGKELVPGNKFCTNCGKRVPIGVATPPPAPKMVTPPAPPQPPIQKATVPPPAQKVATPPQPPVPKVAAKAASVASAATSMARVFDIKASSQKGTWVASSWDMPALAKSSPTALLTRVKNFFIPANKLAYAWFLLPVLTTAITIISYIFHQIGQLFS